MTTTHLSGPAIISGAYTSPATQNTTAGPSAIYHGWSLLDPRFQYNPGYTGVAQVRGIMESNLMPVLEAVPTAPTANMIVATQTTPVVPAGGSLTLPLQSTLATGRAISVPLLPFGLGSQSSNVVYALCLEPGHTVGTTTAGGTSITSVGDTGLIALGSYLAVVGGATGGVLPQIVQVTGRTTTTLTVTPAVATAQTGTPLIPMEKTGLGASPYMNAGSVSLFDAYGSCSRGVSVTTTAADTTFSVLVSGYDVYGVPMSELIACGSATTVNGNKAFKYISSVAVTKSGGGTMAGNVTVGTSDKIGLATRAEFWEYLQVYFNGVLISTGTNFVAGLAKGTASTTTTADVRGTYAPGTTNGSARLVIFAQLPARQLVASTPADSTRMFGQAQA